MPFQPFGYQFEIRSPLAPRDLKTAIRTKKKPWLHPKNGARGWIVGPFICLWFSIFDSDGPMVLGLIARDGRGTRLRGRAGSNLNGVLMFTLLIPLMSFLVFQMISDGSASPGPLVAIAVVFLVGGPFLYRFAHQHRREAEPLVRFLETTTTRAGHARHAKADNAILPRGFALISGDGDRDDTVTATQLRDALMDLGAGDFLILESAAEIYIQTAARDGGYILEMREGDRDHHFQAMRQDSMPLSGDPQRETIFAFEEVLSAFMAFGSDAPPPQFLRWKQLQFPE